MMNVGPVHSHLETTLDSDHLQIWTLNHNFVDHPRDFDPLRHPPGATSNEMYAINTDSTKRPHFTFGAGRRVCPGFHVAERGLFIAISRMLWGFELHRVCGADGQFEPIDRDAVTPGFIVRPEAHKLVQPISLIGKIANEQTSCDIRPRDPERARVIQQAWAEAQTQLDSEGNFKEEFFQTMFTTKDMDR